MLEHVKENACLRLSVRFGPRGHAMEVENISTSMACPRAPQRTESLIVSCTIEIRGCLIRANPGWPGLVEHAQSSYIGETRVDIA